MRALTSAGPRAVSTLVANMRWNWWRLRRTLSPPIPALTWPQCSRRPAQCRSCLVASSTRSARAWSVAWRGRAAIPTGFTAFEYAIGAKWLELLKEVAPRMTRAAVFRGFTLAARIGQFSAIQATAPFGIELSAVGLHDAAAIEPAVAAFARDANGGLVVTAAPFGGNHPDVIPTLAARYKLPAVYPFRYFVNAGGLM